MEERKVYEVLAWASSFLDKHERDAHVAEVLMEYHLGVSHSAYHMMMREKMTATQCSAYVADIKAHAQTGVPVQHLIGYAFFYGRKFTVNEHVLIPRFETEELVYHVINQVKTIDPEEPITIVDVGTGTGAIAITLALELKNAIVYATDISKEALSVAEENARKLRANVKFRQGNFLQPIIDERVEPQILVSNPPYIDRAVDDMLTDTVRDYDPHLALFADNHGLAAYEEIVAQSSNISTLTSICFEIGYDQANVVQQIVLHTYPQCKVEKITDINGRDRIISTSFL